MPSPLIRPLRRGAVLLLAGALTAIGTVGTAAPAEAAPSMRASVSVSSRTAHAGARVVVVGSVHAGRAAAARVAVSVEQRTTGTRTWVVLRRATTSSTGRVVVRTTALSRSKQFRLRVLSAAGTPVVSPTAAVAVPTAVAVTATSPLTVDTGDAVVLAGTTTAQLAGRRVFLQWLHDGSWRSVGSSVVTADATFNVNGLATLGGEQSYRALVKAAPGLAQAVSAPVEFTISAWYRLADLAPLDVTGAVRIGRAVIGGTVLEQSVAARLQEGESASVSYRLTSRCSAFRAVDGAEDGADAGFSGRWRLFADDHLALEATLGGGPASQQEVRISGADVLRLRTFALTGGASAAWGDAEVLCAGRP